MGVKKLQEIGNLIQLPTPLMDDVTMYVITVHMCNLKIQYGNVVEDVRRVLSLTNDIPNLHAPYLKSIRSIAIEVVINNICNTYGKDTMKQYMEMTYGK